MSVKIDKYCVISDKYEWCEKEYLVANLQSRLSFCKSDFEKNLLIKRI